ncbi:GNAT family N-acetyltransferase, partial [archaeon]|nr:GNAT family N-acetyltransferase [archaeon]
MRIDKYRASKGIEYFISLNNQDNKLIGFLRLRINDTQQNTLDILKYSGIIRELHIYGKVSKVGTKTDIYSQHKGFGKMLLDKAEEITRKNEMYSEVLNRESFDNSRRSGGDVLPKYSVKNAGTVSNAKYERAKTPRRFGFDNSNQFVNPALKKSVDTVMKKNARVQAKGDCAPYQNRDNTVSPNPDIEE